jgi:hypothetical protein
VSSRFSVRNAGAAENRRKCAYDGTAHRGGGAKRKVLREREHTRVVSAADSLRGFERANMTGQEGKGFDHLVVLTADFYIRKLSRLSVVTSVSQA